VDKRISEIGVSTSFWESAVHNHGCHSGS
jgi:hypothetical protein